MNFFSVLVLLIFLLNKGHSDSLNSKYNIIKSALAYFQSRSAVLIYDDGDKQWEIRDTVALLNLQKLLSFNNFYFSSLTTLPSLSEALRNGRQGMRETIAVFEFNENFIDFLIKVSNESVRTSYKWLLTSTSPSEKLDELTVPLNCEFLVAQGNPQEGYEVTETYNVDRRRKLKKSLGRWTFPDQFHINASSDLFNRRKNFEGTTIKVISPREDVCMHTSFSTAIATLAWCIHQIIWDLAAEMLNATTQTTIVPNLTPDVIVNSDADLTLRSAAFNVVDIKTRSYVWPAFRTRVVVAASYIMQQVEWRTYILPFSNDMWIIVLVWVIVCDLILTLFELMTDTMKKGNFFSLYRSEFSFSTAFTVCNQGVLGPSKFTGIRIIFVMMFVIPAVLFPGYSAVLTSFLTVQLNKKPFQNLEELSRLKEYKIGWHKTFALQYLFNLEDKSPVNQALLTNNVLPQEKLSATDAESVERMCKEKFVFFTMRDTLLALKPKCGYYKLKQPFKVLFTSIEVKKDSWYKLYFDRCMRRVIFTGLMDRIKLHTVLKHLDYNKAFFVEPQNLEPIKMDNIILPFAVLMLGMVSSALLLVLEVICFRLNSNHGQQQQQKNRPKRVKIISI